MHSPAARTSSAPPAIELDPESHGDNGGERTVTRRPALDGMRALAVAVVVIYHFGGGATSWLPGGFLGVDVFFVLSGYLITGLMISEYDRYGRIDLLRFWTRRLRRLFPALVLVLLAVSAWIWWATPPDDYPMRRSDVFWTLRYAANWHLINTSETYFAAYTSASPLRHTWSLAIEEQFYLLWPIIVLLTLLLGKKCLGRVKIPALRGSRSLSSGRVLVVVVAVVGVGLSAFWMAKEYDPLYPSRDYFSTRGRAQELLVGALLAMAVPWLRRRERDRAAWMRVLITISAAGLAALLIAITLLPDNTRIFYYGGGLCICLSVAAVIAGLEIFPAGILARLFSMRPAVGLGRISYGVYLWHWPLVVAIPVNSDMPFREILTRQSLRVLITLGFSVASFFLVEQPILRSRRLLKSPIRVIAAVATASALVIAVTIPATALPGSLAEQLTQGSDTACPGERNDQHLFCALPAGADVHSRPVKLAIMGDSTARALGPGLNDWADRTGSTWVDAAWKLCTSSGQLILPVHSLQPDLASEVCHNQTPGLIASALAQYQPPVVLVAEDTVSSGTLLVDGRPIKAKTPEHDAALRAGYLALVDQVAAYGGRVVFIELPPPGNQLGTAVATGRPAGHSRTPVPGGQYVDGFNAVLRSVAAARPQSARTVSITDLVCPNGTCSPVQGNMLIRFDGVHYTYRFARYMVPILLQRIGLSTG